MSYLLLNFAGKSEAGSKLKKDVYNTPLKDQYENLRNRYSELKHTEFKLFIDKCFPPFTKKYFISIPNILRKELEEDEPKFINNVVLRSPRWAVSETMLPKGIDVILIGDISIKHREFQVKGIEFIDESVYKHGETELEATAAIALTMGNRNEVYFPEYGLSREDREDNILTWDVMDEISSGSYTIPDPAGAIEIYNEWNEYIAFREYYLREQGNEFIPFDQCEAIKCYPIPKNEYHNNREKYEGFLLKGLDTKKDDILVTKQFDDVEMLPLIQTILDKNRKELMQTLKNGKPEFELKLNRFTRSEVQLESSTDRKRYIRIGDRYKFSSEDIEPDYSETESEFSKKLKLEHEEIDRRFNAALTNTITEHIQSRIEVLKKRDDEILTQYEKELSNNLEKDVAENKDEAVLKQYNAIIKSKEKVKDQQAEKIKGTYNKRIREVEKGKDKDHNKTIEELKSRRDSELKALEEELVSEKAAVSLRSLYESRNEDMISQKRIKLDSERKEQLRLEQEDKRRKTSAEMEPQILSEKEKVKRSNSEGLAAKKEEMKEELTIRRYYIYFKTDDSFDRVSEDIKKTDPKRYTYNQIPEKAKINRQKTSLNNFFDGYVKNPFLSTYLFAPDELKNMSSNVQDLDFYIKRLNEMQKEAVKRAIASESIFLLQGPPGTGKTEVIAEITAQFVKRGRRVLISSETHKAIDNVFDRLPKIPEIRPLRMIASESQKESKFSPEKLVDNFYVNISGGLEEEVRRFEDFNDHKEQFGEELNKLRLDNDKLNRERSRIQNVDIKLRSISSDLDSLKKKYETAKEKLRLTSEEKGEIEHLLRSIERFDTGNDRVKQKIERLLESIIAEYPIFKPTAETLAFIYRSDMEEVKKEIEYLSGDPVLLELEAERDRLREEIDALRDPRTLEYTDEKRFGELKRQLIKINKDIDGQGSTDLSSLKISDIINKAELEKAHVGTLIVRFMSVKEKLIDWAETEKKEISGELIEKTKEFNAKEDEIAGLKKNIREKEREEQNEKEDADYESHLATESQLRDKVAEFIKKFKVSVSEKYDVAEALDLIEERWKELNKNYKKEESSNKKKIPMYKNILKFLKELKIDGTIENDRDAYTKKLFEKANVFGLTCTSRENFKQDSMAAFEKYDIAGLNVKEQGIDIVIIDEVSKSSFLDVLTPILYGKTVILVGDHRQLPPMYDLRYLRGDDFDGMDPRIINKEVNDKYTELYEECFFKTLFENVPDKHKITLTKQYRSHEDIMRVFNHFYSSGGGEGCLELGKPNQNDEKQHRLLIKNRDGKTIIAPNKHIYFIDCGDSFEDFGDSTSGRNKKEADVIVSLAKEIDKHCENKFTVDKKRGIDERMSMGVICTYGDQAGLIKSKLKKRDLKNISESDDERFIISTVDDFQGDERDIIFVSMVRNPYSAAGKRKNTPAEFVKKYERINVALSRARRLLIVVGAKEFLSSLAIDLPDMSGKKALEKKAYRIYREIIGTISQYGLTLNAADILGGE